jgi:hypothetical protein
VESGNRLEPELKADHGDGVQAQHALHTMFYFLHMSPLLNNEQVPPVQIDRIFHSAVSVVAMTSAAVLRLHLAGAYNAMRRDLSEFADICLLKSGEMEVI